MAPNFRLVLLAAATLVLATSSACSGDDGDPNAPSACACDVTPGDCDATCTCDPLCGTDTGELPPGFSDPLNPAEDARTLAEALCNQIQRCAPAVFDSKQDTLQACIADETGLLTAIFQAYELGIQSERMGFSRARLNACIDARDNADCVLGLDPGVCELSVIFAGTQAVGEPCSVTGECAGTAWCPVEEAAMCGACLERASSGGACAQTLCPIGEGCFDAGEIRCLSTSRTEGEACGRDNGFCNGNLVCVGNLDFGPGVCQRPASTIGAPCDPDGETAPQCNLSANLVCGENGTCEQAVWVGPDQPCGRPFLCDATTLGCIIGEDVCLGAPGAGERCATSCINGFFCDPDGFCQPVRGEGAGCAENSECAYGLSCRNGSCSAIAFDVCL